MKKQCPLTINGKHVFIARHSSFVKTKDSFTFTCAVCNTIVIQQTKENDKR
jgi:hypothetical protein